MNILTKSAVALTLLMGMGVAHAAVTQVDDSTWDAGILTSSVNLNVAVDKGDYVSVLFHLNSLSDVTFSALSTASATVKKTSSFFVSLFLDGVSTSIKSEQYSGVNKTAATAGSVFKQLTEGNYIAQFSTIGVNQTAALKLSSVAAVPEPETYALMGVGLLGLLAARRRKVMES